MKERNLYILFNWRKKYRKKMCEKNIYVCNYIHMYLIHWGHMARRGLLVIGAIG